MKTKLVKALRSLRLVRRLKGGLWVNIRNRGWRRAEKTPCGEWLYDDAGFMYRLTNRYIMKLEKH